jgi:hypothetical protein
MGKLATVALLFGVSAAAVAQSRIAMGRPSPGFSAGSGRHFAGSVRVVERGQHPWAQGRPFFYGYGPPYFYADDYYEPYPAEYARPEPAPQPAPVVQEKPGPLPEPVLLELHGDQWVKVTNFGHASQQTVSSSAKANSQPAKPMSPAVLIYRDGRTEEISSYSIIGSSIYTKSDYYSSGSWTRTIQIADLDVPATLKQNEQRGVKFDLPSGPNEIVIRP